MSRDYFFSCPDCKSWEQEVIDLTKELEWCEKTVKKLIEEKRALTKRLELLKEELDGSL
jgi:regulator of replication initiation timing